MKCLTLAECNAWRDEHSRRHTWKRQATYVTPLKHFPWYSATLVEQLLPFKAALLIVDAVILGDSKKLNALRAAAGELRPIHKSPGHLFVNDPEGLRRAIEAALSAWIDLRVLLSPPRHALRADHDEYTTLFSESPGSLRRLRMR